jgi:hypothetical protein
MATRSVGIASLRYYYAVSRKGSRAYFLVIGDLLTTVDTLMSKRAFDAYTTNLKGLVSVGILLYSVDWRFKVGIFNFVGAELQRKRRFWHGLGDFTMPSWTLPAAAFDRLYSVSAVANATAVTITMAGDDITREQPATAARGQSASSTKGGVGRGLSRSS